MSANLKFQKAYPFLKRDIMHKMYFKYLNKFNKFYLKQLKTFHKIIYSDLMLKCGAFKTRKPPFICLYIGVCVCVCTVSENRQ